MKRLGQGSKREGSLSIESMSLESWSMLSKFFLTEKQKPIQRWKRMECWTMALLYGSYKTHEVEKGSRINQQAIR